MPATETVTLARQGNERENSDHSRTRRACRPRSRPAGVRHAATSALEFTSRGAVRAGARRARHARARHIYAPNPFDPVTRLRTRHRRVAYSTGRRTRSASTRSTPSTSATRVAAHRRASRASTTTPTFTAVDAAGAVDDRPVGAGRRSSAARRACSTGSPTTATSTSSYGIAVTPPGTANFTLSAQPNNQNNPNVEPQESTNYEVGSKWDFYGGRLSLNARGVPHREQERHLHGRRDGDSADLQPGRRQRVNGRHARRRSGSITEQLATSSPTSRISTSRRDRQNPVERRQAPHADAGVLGQRLDDLPLPRGLTVGGGVRYTDEVFVNAANTIKSPGYSARRRAGRVRRQPAPVAAAQRLQPHRRDLHPQRQQQRRPLQPRHAAVGDRSPRASRF